MDSTDIETEALTKICSYKFYRSPQTLIIYT